MVAIWTNDGSLPTLFYNNEIMENTMRRFGRMIILLVCIAAVTGTVANAAPQKGKGGDEEGVLSWPPEWKGVLIDI